MRFTLPALRSTLATTAVALALGGCASLLTGGPLIKNPNDPKGMIVIENRTREPVKSVLISSCSANTYGLNRMKKNERVYGGGTRGFEVSAGCWDVMAGNDNDAPRRRLNVPAGGQAVYRVGG
ncbi:MAG TPA: hypothetical protein VF263_16285 [Longimicrobiaceae bacterium]